MQLDREAEDGEVNLQGFGDVSLLCTSVAAVCVRSQHRNVMSAHGAGFHGVLCVQASMYNVRELCVGVRHRQGDQGGQVTAVASPVLNNLVVYLS